MLSLLIPLLSIPICAFMGYFGAKKAGKSLIEDAKADVFEFLEGDQAVILFRDLGQAFFGGLSTNLKQINPLRGTVKTPFGNISREIALPLIQMLVGKYAPQLMGAAPEEVQAAKKVLGGIL